MTTQDALHIWTIYDHPRDYSKGFIARMFVVRDGYSGPTDITVTGETLDEVRDKIPQGLYCMPRQEQDDPVIVESWL